MQQKIYTGIPDELTKHNFAKIMQISHINPDMEYADDVSKVSSNYNDIKKFKDEAPKVLFFRGFQVDYTKTAPTDHSYMQQEITTIPDEITKQNYPIIRQINHINLDVEYADDFFVWSNYNNIRKFKDEAPKVLLSRRLQVDNTKTEVYVIKENNNWDKCKLLGSLLDFIEDIKWSKTLAITAANIIEHISKNKRIVQTSKMQAFEIDIQSTFLYNCDIWI